MQYCSEITTSHISTVAIPVPTHGKAKESDKNDVKSEEVKKPAAAKAKKPSSSTPVRLLRVVPKGEHITTYACTLPHVRTGETRTIESD